MAKQGMKRPDTRHHSEASPVPELQGKPKNSKEKAKPVKK